MEENRRVVDHELDKKEDEHQGELRQAQQRFDELAARCRKLEDQNAHLNKGEALRRSMAKAASNVKAQIQSLKSIVQSALKGSDSMITSDGAMVTKPQLETWKDAMDHMSRTVDAFMAFE